VVPGNTQPARGPSCSFLCVAQIIPQEQLRSQEIRTRAAHRVPIAHGVTCSHKWEHSRSARCEPLNLVYVADLSKRGQSDSEAEFFTAADVGFISENVYLFCTSELATVVRGSVDRAALAKIMKLGPNQKILLAQSVGYPKK
jgi:hypothetical protein